MDLETYALLKKKINNISANNISYDNSQSAGLISTNVNDALDELSTKLGIKMVTVSELPLVGDLDILYIVPKSTPEQGNYSDEYTWNATRQDYDKVGDTLISPLPDVTSSDNGKVLGVVNGEWDKYTVPKELPTVSSSDNGKVLSVVSGSWNKKSLTKSDIGLGNVDNTSDLNKPISTATQSALDTKLSEDDLYNMTEDSTVSGNPVTLKTLAKTSAKSCEVTFSPIQSGSGDPSPENVRPISGWDSLVLVDSGKNQFDKSAKNTANGYVASKYLTINGTQSTPGSNPDNWFVSEYIPVTPNTKVTISGLMESDSTNPSICEYDNSKSFLKGTAYLNRASFTFTTSPTTKYVRLSAGAGQTYWDSIQLEYGEQATSYKSYIAPTTHTATFPDTVYGGVWKATEGKAVIKWGIVDLGTFTWDYNDSDSFAGAPYFSSHGSYTPVKINSQLRCSNYKYKSGGRGSIKNNDVCMWNITTAQVFAIRDDSYTDADTFKTAMNGVKLCFELVTPQEITLTQETIALLKGNNTLWTDGNNFEIVYEKLDLTELPDVTSADEGKVLTVNSNGEWVAQTLPDGTNISY